MLKRVMCIGLLALCVAACSKDEQKVTKSNDGVPLVYEHMGGEGNVHFVYIDTKKFHGARYDHWVNSKSICESHGTTDNCEVYVWNNKRLIPETLPIRNRSAAVGYMKMLDGDVVKFKEVNNIEEVFDTYGVDDNGRASR